MVRRQNKLRALGVSYAVLHIVACTANPIGLYPPGARSGKHLHVGEEAHIIIEGRAYDEIDGQKWEWETNDVVSIPLLATHQSFNTDTEHPARVLVFKSRLYEYMSFAGIEHIEDASPI